MNSNQNPNHCNLLRLILLRLISPLLVSFLGFFQGEAQALFPPCFTGGGRGEVTLPASRRNSPNNPNHGPDYGRNALYFRLIGWLAFLDSFSSTPPKILTTRRKP